MPGVQGSGGGSWVAARSRGQTLQDFAIGIGLFIVVLGAVLAAFFSFVQPFSVGVDGEDVSESTRVAETVVQNLSRGHEPNELDAGLARSAFDRSASRLRLRWGLENATSVNVTVETLNGTRVVVSGGTRLAAGATYGDRAAATTSRIVTLSDGSCDPACRLTVRVW